MQRVWISLQELAKWWESSLSAAKGGWLHMLWELVVSSFLEVCWGAVGSDGGVVLGWVSVGSLMIGWVYVGDVEVGWVLK